MGKGNTSGMKLDPNTQIFTVKHVTLIQATIIVVVKTLIYSTDNIST